ncbi:hypothetical protein BC628DRAFT_427491 [Trametes gibbosa]|nr:hypothetical protein BC628DRAFT_427491 [Trametes gibbosa]
MYISPRYSSTTIHCSHPGIRLASTYCAIFPLSVKTSQPVSSMSSSTGVPSLGRTYGALYIGSCLGFMLYGLTVHQVYKYYKLYPSDIAFLKYMVLSIFVLETFHTILWVIDGYHYLIQDYFTPDALNFGHWTDKVNILFTGLVIIMCQGFYARRVYLISSRFRVLVAIAVLCMSLFIGFDIAAGVMAFTTPNLVTFARSSWMISAAYGFALVTDVILTGTLVYVLLSSRTGLKHIVVAKLYANSVLAVLNSRRALQHRLLDDVPISISVHDMAPRRHNGIMESWSVPQLPVSTTLKFATYHTAETQGEKETSMSGERSSEGESAVRAAEDV